MNAYVKLPTIPMCACVGMCARIHIPELMSLWQGALQKL